MLKRHDWKSSSNSIRTSTERMKVLNLGAWCFFGAWNLELLPEFSPLPRSLICFQAPAFDTLELDPALFLAFFGLHLFRRVEVVPLVLPDEPFAHHSLKVRSGPMRVLTEFFSVHDLVDVLIEGVTSFDERTCGKLG